MSNLLQTLGGAVGALPSVASGVATNVMNKRQADRAMRDNWKMNTIHNDMAEAFFNADLAHQWDMWNANNVYNTPKAQKQRMLEAGLNPYTNSLDAGKSQGMGSGHGSVPGAIPMTPAVKQSVMNQHLGNLASEFYRVQEQKADVQGKNIDNQYRSTKNALDLANTVAGMHNVNANTRKTMLENIFSGASLNARLAEANQRPEFLRQQTQSLILNNELAKVNLKYIDQEKIAEINYTIAQTLRTYAEKKRIETITPAELQNIVSRTFLQNKQNWNLPIRNKKDADRYSEAFIQSAENAAALSGYDAGKASSKDVEYWWGKPSDVETIIDILSPLR